MTRAEDLRRRAVAKVSTIGAIPVPSVPEVSDDKRSRILKASATELRDSMRSQELKCTEVLAVLITQCEKVGRAKLNAITEQTYAEALEAAQQVDRLGPEAWESQPLLGIPVSIKDQFHQRGCVSTCGAAVRCDQVQLTDGLLVSLLRDAGAIPFVRSNVPQLLMLPESANNVFGETRNPWDITRTVGGSSGGEGGLIGSGCSPLGLGSDIGGSIRIPAHFNGVTGFKPTAARVSRMGMGIPRVGERNGQAIIAGVVGPLARTVEDCALMMQALWVPRHFATDVSVPPLPFDAKMYESGPGRPLRIGSIRSDGWFAPCATGTRAVAIAEDAMRALGHTIVPIELPVDMDGWEVSRLYYGLMAADGNMSGFVRGLEGEALHPSYTAIKKISDLPNFIRPFLKFLLGLVGEKRKATLVGVTRSGGLSVRQYWELVCDYNALRAKWAAMMADKELDCLVTPTLALPAFPLFGEKLEILIGIVEGLNFIHEMNYIHGDIKPSNILMGDNNVPKIGDLGSALRFRHDEPVNAPMCGTVEFMAPELFADVREYTPAADIFSIGILMWCMAFEKRGPEFPGINDTMTLGHHIIDRLQPSLQHVSPQLRDLINDCTQLERKLRPSASALLKSLKTLHSATDLDALSLFCVQAPTPAEAQL